MKRAPSRVSRAVPAAPLAVLLASGLSVPGCAGPVSARAQASPAAAIEAHDWQAAHSAVDATPDALAATLVTYLRLLAPDASASDIADFLAAHPDWPNRTVLHARYDAALAGDADDGAVVSLCRRERPGSPGALARCAVAARSGDASDAASWARQAWRDGIDSGLGDDAAEAGFVGQWGGVLTDEDHWQRFERISPPVGEEREAAARAVGRLKGLARAIATARVALAAGTPDPLALWRAVPPAGQDDPGLVLLTARQLRHDGANEDAVAFWRTRGMAVEAGQPPSMQALFWAERDLMARALLAEPGHDREAFAIADDRDTRSIGARVDALFLAGWIALRRLGEPAVASDRFTALAGVSDSVTTRARAAYWLARADGQAGQQADALRHDALAAAFPTTFYGQRGLASLAQGEGEAAFLGRLRGALASVAAPVWTSSQAVAFASGVMPRAAILLVAWGQARHAKAFLGEADARATGAVDHALAADLAVTLGLPDEAIAIARRAGREGHALTPIGWPRPVTPPSGLPAPLLLGLMRQESGFDAEATSPSGALGLMQLLPGTAGEVAGTQRVAFTRALLTSDPSLNMRLGAVYLARLLDRFGGNVPVAVAAYNAGPHRVSGWAPAPGGSGGAMVDEPDEAMIDWIETIPVAETRNYVERVLENQAVYAALGPQAGSG